MRHEASALILACIFIVVLVLLGQGLLGGSINENRITQKYIDSVESFWVAEAGLNRALVELRDDFDQSGSDLFNGTVSQGNYTVDVTNSGTTQKIITVSATYGDGTGITREIKAIISKQIPSDFYDNAIYTADDVTINGSSFSVDGDIMYADDYDVQHPENVSGFSTQDASIAPLARFNFETLLAMSQAQTAVYASGNVYDVDPNNKKLLDPLTGDEKPLPTRFWYWGTEDGIDNDNDGEIDEPDEDGLDNDGDGTIDEADENVPNIVYINGDLKVNGNIGTIGGFLIVVGDVITNPSGTYDAEIVGEGSLDGVLYTLGEFDVNGGGSTGFDVNGGVWAGQDVTINGSADIFYNATYMSSIAGLNIEPVPQVTSWQDSQNPYELYQ